MRQPVCLTLQEVLDLPPQLLALGLLAQAGAARRLAVALLAPHLLHLPLISHRLQGRMGGWLWGAEGS